MNCIAVADCRWLWRPVTSPTLAAWARDARLTQIKISRLHGWADGAAESCPAIDKLPGGEADRQHFVVVFVGVLRPHRTHGVHRCGLLLQTSHAVWSVCRSYGCGWIDRDAVRGAYLWMQGTMQRWGQDGSCEGWQINYAAFCQITLDTC